jgi:hypothetical protein
LIINKISIITENTISSDTDRLQKLKTTAHSNAKGIYLLHCSVTLFFDNKKNLDYSDIIFIANE